MARRAPEKIVFQLFSAWLFEAENLATLRIDPGHYMPDGPVLATCVHPLKNKQQRIAVGRIMEPLQRTQFGNMCFQEFLIPFLRFEKWLHQGRPLLEYDLFVGLDPEIL